MNSKFLGCAGPAMLIGGLVLAMAGRMSGNLAVAAVAFLLIFASFGVIHFADQARRKENQKNPITEVEATVVGHRMETHHTRYSHSQTYYMTFRPENGSENIEFEVPEADYQDYSAGDKGPLRYRTWEYLSFCAKDMSSVEPIVPLPEEYEPSSQESSAEDGWYKVEKLLDVLTEKVAMAWQKVKQCFCEQVKAKPEQDERVAEADNGILTHELDE